MRRVRGGVPPGWIGHQVVVQWDDLHLRVLHPTTRGLLREHLCTRHGHLASTRPTGPRASPRKRWCCSTWRGRRGRPPARYVTTSTARRGPRAAPHPRRAGARTQSWPRAHRRCGPLRTRSRRAIVPLYSPLSRTREAAGYGAQTYRSAHPPSHRLPRSHRTASCRLLNVTELDRAIS